MGIIHHIYLQFSEEGHYRSFEHVRRGKNGVNALYAIFCFLLLPFLVPMGVHAQTFNVDSIKEGDLLFAYVDDSNAITSVTQGIGDMAIDHVGILAGKPGQWTVIEAVHKGVQEIPLDSFICHHIGKSGHPNIIIGRVATPIDIPASIERARKQLGKPYDFNFMPDDKEFYCSELVQKSYVDGQGNLIFHPIPMSFHDKNGNITLYWQEYYARQGLEVPEGKDGSNPGDLSRNPVLKIINQ
ncbi:MAG: YiiX/YebB-like N1pC/P60 family cysteine hydrolase [Prevotella sp.]|jgi:uncharacterized protein YycO